jgi:hypothetical protein
MNRLNHAQRLSGGTIFISGRSSMPSNRWYMLPNWPNLPQGLDTAGQVDVAAIEIDRVALPGTAFYRAFTPQHLLDRFDQIEVGTSLLVIGFPLGFHDTLHHLPVARQAMIASSFGLRFQGQGYFLTDARTHRGTSGAPAVMRVSAPDYRYDDLPWLLLGIHSSRLDVGTRNLDLDEALGLNCAWYADILLTLTTLTERWLQKLGGVAHMREEAFLEFHGSRSKWVMNPQLPRFNVPPCRNRRFRP